MNPTGRPTGLARPEQVVVRTAGSTGAGVDVRRPAGAMTVALVLVVVVAWVLWALRDTDGADGGVVATTEGLDLTGVQLTSVEDGIDPTTGLPTEERSSYEVGEGARLWVQFTYTGDDPGRDALHVRWYREGEEVFQSSWRLPQPVENHNVALGSSYTEEAGSYRVEVLLNDEVLATETFSVE